MHGTSFAWRCALCLQEIQTVVFACLQKQYMNSMYYIILRLLHLEIAG